MPGIILLVDDQAEFREIFSIKLASAGFHVEVADGGEHAVEIAKRIIPDLILMDVEMPGTSGVDALLKIKADPVTKNVRVIFLTNLGDPQQDWQKLNSRISREIGAAGYIKKTENLDVLVQKVKDFLALPV